MIFSSIWFTFYYQTEETESHRILFLLRTLTWGEGVLEGRDGGRKVRKEGREEGGKGGRKGGMEGGRSTGS